MPVSSKKKQGRDSAVQGTNDSSAVSKVSAAAQGYFKDDFLKYFVCKVSRRAPLINRGYYIRWKAVDHCVRQFLQSTQHCPYRQIVSLGAGFDSLYFRLHGEGALKKMVVFELDFPDVARRKAALINADICLKEGLKFPSPCLAGLYVSGEDYRLVGVDVRKENQMEEVLAGAGIDWAAPTLLLSEVVLTYMETQWSDGVIGWSARHFSQSLFVMYEQIRPQDPFGQIMQDHFLKLNSTLHALRDYPDTAAQTQRFLGKGWEQCVCMDGNEFYQALVPEKERGRVESLEPFDEFEEWHQKCSHYFILTACKGSLTSHAVLRPPPESPLPSLRPVLSPVSLMVRPVSGLLSLEGLGMASTPLRPDMVLLTGGSNRGGRGAAARVLVTGQAAWRCASVASSTDWGVRLYHTVNNIPGWGNVVYGGRSSPLHPIRSLLKVTCDLADPTSHENMAAVSLSSEQITCTGILPPPRWRHTATMLSYRGQDFLFVFGGRNETEAALGDAHFLSLNNLHWTEMSVEGIPPEARLSHSACPYKEGVVVFGGLGRGGVPLGDTTFLRPTTTGFCWESLAVHPQPVPRYSHNAHVIGQRLVVVGGVWLQAEGVPGIAVIDLITGSGMEFQLDTMSVPWPLMLHSFCSQLLDPEEPTLALMCGGGNCFSFGTHHNPCPVIVDLRPAL
ncbi:tRNA wybutosine-synthesizing protein 4 [Osmerus mordax]|uniref:tRNA wybutosine-synthesizing protein 4 n=1 Tax=Osmerus mordax TaxID=8014 RepID=UPI00350F29FF